MSDLWIVICRADRQPDDAPGKYVLATRYLFSREADAEAYARSIAASRQPLVVSGEWSALRWQPQVANPSG